MDKESIKRMVSPEDAVLLEAILEAIENKQDLKAAKEALKDDARISLDELANELGL